MKPRSFIIGCIILTVAVMLCATPVIGPMVGFFVGIAIAFFGVPLIMLVGGSLGLEYSTANLATIGQYVAIGYAMLMCIPVVVPSLPGPDGGQTAREWPCSWSSSCSPFLWVDGLQWRHWPRPGPDLIRRPDSAIVALPGSPSLNP